MNRSEITQNLGDSGHGGALKLEAVLRRRSVREMDRFMVWVLSEGVAGTEVLGSWQTLVIGW